MKIKKIAAAFFVAGVTSMAASAGFAQFREAPVSNVGSGESAGGFSLAPSEGFGFLPTPRGVRYAARVEPNLGATELSRAAIEATGAVFSRPRGELALSETAMERMPSGESAETILNWDSRMRAYTTEYPNRAIGLLTLNGFHHCTAWMVGRDTAVTAGHCVHSGGSSGSWYNASQMRFWPGRDGTSAPFGSCGVRILFSNTGWTVSDNPEADYGAIKLDCTVGTQTGWFGIYSLGHPASFIRSPAIISGYPGDKPQTQWLSADIVRVSRALRVCYRMDTIGGHSGSPIWNDRLDALSTTGAWAFAVHAYGSSSCSAGGPFNWAPRFSTQRVQMINAWIAR